VSLDTISRGLRRRRGVAWRPARSGRLFVAALRQVPAITESEPFDPTGHEQLRVSRLAMDVIGSKSRFSNDPKFKEAMARKTYFSPIYFRKESEPT